MQHARALGVALLGHALLALAVAAELLGTLAFGTDQAFLTLAVDVARDIAAAVVATRDVDLPAPCLGSGDLAPGRFDALALLAFALLALRLVAACVVALRQLHATRFAAGLASRRLGPLRLLAPLRIVAGALLPVANRLRALRLFPLRLHTLRRLRAAIGLVALRRLLPSCVLALRGLQLLPSRALALAVGLRLLTGPLLLPRVVLSRCGCGTLASGLFA